MAGNPEGDGRLLQVEDLADGGSRSRPGEPLCVVLLGFPFPSCFSTPKALMLSLLHRVLPLLLFVLLLLLFVVKVVVTLFGFSIVEFRVWFGSMVRLLRVMCGLLGVRGEMLMERKKKEEETRQMIERVTTKSILPIKPQETKGGWDVEETE